MHNIFYPFTFPITHTAKPSTYLLALHWHAIPCVRGGIITHRERYKTSQERQVFLHQYHIIFHINTFSFLRIYVGLRMRVV